jgi:hypothetical protein
MVQAFSEAVAKVPLFSCQLEQRKEGMFYKPYWVFNPEVQNRMVVEDCRPMVGDSYDLEDFVNTFFQPKIRRRLDIFREFPYNSMLLQVEDETWVLGVVFHHSVVDPLKAFIVLTHALARYHQLVKGAWPKWAMAESTGDVIRKKKGSLVKPLPFSQFAKEQMLDLWVKNRKGVVNSIASRKIRDYRKTKGRYSFLRVIQDKETILALVDRAVKAGCTLNDLCFAVARKTFSQWNQEKGKPADRFRFMLATSLLGRMELPKNGGAGLGALNMVSAVDPKSDLDTLMQDFKRQRMHQLGRGVDIRLFKTMTTLIGAMRVFPLKMRASIARPMIEAIPVNFAISNIGSIWPKEIYPDGRQSLESKVTDVGDFKIDMLHSSISISRNMEGLSTMRTYNNRTFVNYVFDRFRFHRDEAQELSDRLFNNLLGSIG